jgi:hypothetical protein
VGFTDAVSQVDGGGRGTHISLQVTINEIDRDCLDNKYPQKYHQSNPGNLTNHPLGVLIACRAETER